MYLHIGQSSVVRTRDIVGIFDLDNTSVSRDTRAFLRRAEQDGRVVNVSTELPKSFIVQVGRPHTVYICQIAAGTIKKRCDHLREALLAEKEEDG